MTIAKKRDFQVEDLEQLIPRDWSANFSEMGCYKTTTCLWLVAEKLSHITKPRVLIITTKSGKGTYFKWIPELLPGWTLLNVNANRVNLVLDGIELKYRLARDSSNPLVCVAHYNVFTKRKKKKDDKPVWTVQDELLDIQWDMVILDEAHRIKERDTNWTKQIKKLKATYRHVMTGTGFINNPAEIWSLLHFLNRRQFSSYWKFRQEFCNTPDAPIWMGDFSFKPLGEVQVGDEVVGWTPHDKHKSLTRATVLAVNRRIAPMVLEVTMESGRKFKCTPDHLWLNGRTKGIKDRFTTVEDGFIRRRSPQAHLVHVVDSPPQLDTPEKMRTAAYLGGMYDGEGTWPYIAQSKIANPEAYARIKESLDILGFNYTEDARGFCIRAQYTSRTVRDGLGGYKAAELRDALQTAVNFAALCRPAKLGYIGRSILRKRWKSVDKVADTEIVGFNQEVVSMTTTTGNYIAWGYASKNCEEEVDFMGFRKIVGVNPHKKDEFRQLVRSIGPRRTKVEVFKNLPNPIFTPVVVELNPTQRKMYNDIKYHLYTLDQQGEPISSPNVLAALSRLRQICVATPRVVEDYYDEKLEKRVQKIRLEEPSSKLDALMRLSRVWSGTRNAAIK